MQKQTLIKQRGGGVGDVAPRIKKGNKVKIFKSGKKRKTKGKKKRIWEETFGEGGIGASLSIFFAPPLLSPKPAFCICP